MIDELTIEGVQFTAESAGWVGWLTFPGLSASDRLKCLIDASDTHDAPRAERPTEDQIATLRFVLQNQASVRKEILEETLAYVREFGGDLDELGISIQSADQIGQYLVSPELIIHRQSIDGHAWYALAASTEWDVEHDFGITLWKQLVLDVGHVDVTFSCPSGMTFRPSTSEQEEMRDRIVELLQGLFGDPEQWEDEADYDEMPSSTRMALAILNDDQITFDELAEQGVDLNETAAGTLPAIFYAINSLDTAAVRRMLDAGASLDVKNDMGLSPLQWVQQMVQSQKTALRLSAGDAGVLNQTNSEPTGNDMGNSIDSMMYELEEMGQRGDSVGDAAQSMAEMWSQMADGIQAQADNAPEVEREYLHRLQDESDEMLQKWQDIEVMLRAASTNGG